MLRLSDEQSLAVNAISVYLQIWQLHISHCIRHKKGFIWSIFLLERVAYD